MSDSFDRLDRAERAGKIVVELDDRRAFERLVVDLLEHAAARCGLGFGKYPLGVKFAVKRILETHLEPLESEEVIRAAWDRLEERLKR